MNFLTNTVAQAEQANVELVFQPANFVENLKYMGIGMLVIFAVIGIIILTTMIVNKVFSD